MTQCEAILNYLQQHESITPREADRLCGCMRLAARIADLKDRGHRITSEMVTKLDEEGNFKCRYAVYRLNDTET
jgi:hypothetical protein